MKKIKIRLYAAIIFTALLSISCLTTEQSAFLALEGGRLATGLGAQAEEAIKNSKNKKAAAEQQKAEEEKRQAEAAEKKRIAEEKKQAEAAEQRRLAEEQRQHEEAQKQQAEILRTFTAAVNAKDTATVQRLMEEGFDAKSQLAKISDIENIRFLLKAGVNSGWGELLDAAVLNDIEKLHRAAQNEAELNEWGGLALAQVVANKNPEAVKFLLDEGVAVSAKCEDIAIGNDSADILRLLIKRGGLEASADRLCTTLAAGKAKAATVLIEEGAPIGEGHVDYYEASEWKGGANKGDYAEEYYYSITRYSTVYPDFILYLKYPFVEEKSELSWSLEKSSSLTYAVAEAIPNIDLVALLLKKGAKLDYWNSWHDYNNWSAALHIAIRKDKNADTIPILLKHGADAPNQKIYTSSWNNVAEKYAEPYFLAIQNKDEEEYMVPLIYAVYKNNIKAVSALIKQKYPTELLTGALLVAAHENNTEIAQILIKAGATVTSNIQAAAKTTEMRKLLRSTAKQ